MMIFAVGQPRRKFRVGSAAIVLAATLANLLSSPRSGQVQGKTLPSAERERSGISQVNAIAGADQKKFRLREGTKIENRLGRFEQKSQSATFRTEDGLEFGSLPNLNLQRILDTLKTADKPESMWWSISGTVTEFGGKNHLLISRAVYKATIVPTSHAPTAP